MQKTLRFMLAALLTVLCGNVSAQEEKTATWQASSGDALQTILVGDDLSLKWEEGGGDMAPRYEGGSVRFFNGNRLTVAGTADEVVVKKVKFTFTGERNGIVTCDAKGKNTSSAGITNDNEANTSTWQGEAKSIVFRASQGTGVRYIASVEVTYTGSAAAVEKAPLLKITNSGIASTYDMDQNPVFVAYYENAGTAAAENASLTVFVDGVSNAVAPIGTLAPGATGWKNLKYDVTKIAEGDHQVSMTITADNAQAFAIEGTTVKFTKKAPEASFSLSAQPIELTEGDETFSLSVSVKNTSAVDAKDVKLNLWRNGVIATQTIDELKAGEAKDVKFENVANPFAAPGTYEMQVLTADNKYGCYVNVTVQAKPEEELKDLAITDITGTIELANETSQVRIIVENKGNADISDAPVTLKAGDKLLGTATVSVAKGQTGWCYVAVASEGLEAGDLSVTATVDVEGDATPDDNTRQATLTVKPVPAPEATFELVAENVSVPYDATTYDIVVTVKNTSTVDAADVKVNLLEQTIIDTKTIESLKAGEQTTVTFTIEGGPFTADKEYQVWIGNGLNGNCRVSAVVEAAPIQVGITAMEALATEYNIKAAAYAGAGFNVTLKNYDAEQAAKATLCLMKTGSADVLATQTVNLEAGEEKTTYLSYRATEAGIYKFYAKVEGSSHYQATWPASNAVEVTFIEATEGVDLSVSATPATKADIDEGAFVAVTYANNGTVDAENALLKLFVDDQENAVENLGTLAAGKSGFKSIAYDMTKIAAGEHQVYVALVAGENEAKSDAVAVTFTKKAAEAAYSVTAENVVVPFGAKSFDIVAKVKNTSDVAAADVEVKLLKGIETVATKTIATLAAGAEETVTFTVEGDFEAGKTASYYVQVANKAQAEVSVTFEKETADEVKDLAVVAIQGTIDLSVEQSTVSVTVKNNGNTDVNAAALTLKAGEKLLGTATVSAKAGEEGYAFIQVAAEGLQAGDLEVTATVTLDGDATPADNTLTKTIAVKGVPEAEPVFALTAADVEALYGVKSINVVVSVENTSDVDAQNVEVKLYNGLEQLGETQTIDKLAAGESKDVTFHFVNSFNPGTYDLQAVAGKYGCWLKLVMKPQPEQPVADIALIDIRGLEEINLKQENRVMVTFENNSTGEIGNATIALTMNDALVGTETIAENETYKYFTLPTEGLEAGQTVTLVATLTVENNKEGNLTQVQKQLPVVSGEAEPMADVVINNIASQEVEPGEQEVTVVFGVFNNGDADAENVQIDLYRNYPEILATQTIELVKAGESAFVTMKFSYDFEEGKDYEFTVQTLLADADPSNNTQQFTVSCVAPLADVALAAIADAEATTADEVTIAGVVKNLSTDLAAKDVRVALFQGTEEVGVRQTIDEIAAGGEAPVAFSLGKMEAGTYHFTMQIASKDLNADNNVQSFTLKVTEPEEQHVDLALTAITLTDGQIDLSLGQNSAVVWYENKGNADVEEATLALTVDGKALEERTVAVKAGKTGFASFVLPTEGLTVGEQVTLVATITAEGDEQADNNSLTKEYPVADSSTANEPAFSLTAKDVVVEHDAEKIDVVVSVKNTSAVDAANVDVKLIYGITQLGEVQTIAKLAAGETKDVTFSFDNFGKAGTYELQAIAGKNSGWLNVTVKEAPEDEHIDMAITAIQGIAKIDLSQESNNLMVWYRNESNVEVKTATIGLTLNGKALESKTVSNVKAGANGYVVFSLPTDGLKAHQSVKVVATVATEGDSNADNDSMEREYEVIDSEAIEPTFSMSAEPVEVVLGDETFDVVLTVRNTSDVEATDVEVKLYQNADVLATQTIAKLAAGEQQQITFAKLANNYTKAGSYELTAIAANRASATVSVTVKEPAEEPVTDLAITAIQGNIDLSVETNYITVFVENKGNQDVTDAVVTLTSGNKALGMANVSVKAGEERNTGFCTIAIASNGLEPGEMEVVAKVVVEGDANPDDNELTKTISIVKPVSDIELSAADIVFKAEQESIVVEVTVTNNTTEDMENVEVKVIDANMQVLGTATIATIAAGESEKTTIVIANPFDENGGTLHLVCGDTEIDIKAISDVAVAIKGINGTVSQTKNTVYRLNGTKATTLKKGGLYIINGKKTVLR